MLVTHSASFASTLKFLFKGGGGGVQAIFIGRISFEHRAQQATLAIGETFGEDSGVGTSAPNPLRATPHPTIAPKIGISPS